MIRGDTLSVGPHYTAHGHQEPPTHARLGARLPCGLLGQPESSPLTGGGGGAANPRTRAGASALTRVEPFRTPIWCPASHPGWLRCYTRVAGIGDAGLLGQQGHVLPGTPERPEPTDVFSEPDCAPTGKLQRAALAEPTSVCATQVWLHTAPLGCEARSGDDSPPLRGSTAALCAPERSRWSGDLTPSLQPKLTGPTRWPPS